MATVRHQVHPNVLQAILVSPNGATMRNMLRRGLRVQAAAKRGCPVDQGRLRSSITVRLLPDRVVIGSNVSYAIYVHEGTGIYGHKGRPIRPVNGRYLVWTPRGATKPVFAREVRGMPGRPFLRLALVAARG